VTGRLEQAWTGSTEIHPPDLELLGTDPAFRVLRAGGELDGSVAADLEKLLGRVRDDRPAVLLLDFTDVELVDTVVLGLLEEARAELFALGTQVRIALGGQPLQLLRLTGLDTQMETIACAARGHRHRPGVERTGRMAAAA
jgi:anti-anti-sigma factor